MASVLMLSSIKVIFLFILSYGFCDRIHQKVYYDFNVATACFRRMNATHEIGCASSRGGDVGVVHYVETSDDLQWLIEYGPHQPYVAVLPSQNFNMEFLNKMTSSGKVNGVLVIDSNYSSEALPSSFSPDKSCPNDRYGMYAGHPDYESCKKLEWNSYGHGMAFMNFKMAVMALSDPKEVDYLINNCFQQFNKPIKTVNGTFVPRDYPLCAAEVKTAMDGAHNTPTCIRRSNLITNLNADKYCDPLGDLNVFTTMKYYNRNDPDLRPQKSVIVAATRLDSFSMFDQVAPGAEIVTGIVTLLATAEAIGNVKDDFDDENSKDIMFLFLQGLIFYWDKLIVEIIEVQDEVDVCIGQEAYDYIGSSRLVFEMNNNRFPQKLPSDWDGLQMMNLSHISEVIELSQLGLPDQNKLWLHTDPISRTESTVDSQTDDLVKMLIDQGKMSGANIIEASKTNGLPPASFQTFLKNANISGAVLTDHKTSFSNKYYNSRFDLAQLLTLDYPPNSSEIKKYNFVTKTAQHLTNIATTMARTLYKRATNKDPSSVKANNLTMTRMLYCYLLNPKCELFRTVIDNKKKYINLIENQRAPFNLYVGVDRQTNGTTVLTRSLLAYFTSDVLEGADEVACNAPDKNQVFMDCSETLMVYEANKGKCHGKNQIHPVQDGRPTTFSYYWIRGKVINETTNVRKPICLKSLTNYSAAVSPAFIIKDYNWDSGLYSSWTESIWAVDAMSSRIFLIPSQKQKTVTLSVGVVILLSIMVLVYFINDKADILFQRVPV